MKKVSRIPAHHVTENTTVINPETRNRLTVYRNSVAGQKMIITGTNEVGKIESFCTSNDVEVIIK